jgi:glycerate 2-kinase
MHVLVAPDKFKGSLSAAQVAESLGKGLRQAGIDAILMPLADGGDGSVAAALTAGFRPHACAVADAVGRRRSSCMALYGDTAVVEVANTCGMQTLPAGSPAPMSSTFGFGEAIANAVRLGARRVVLALGGSASTDGGLGMLAALGFHVCDAAGRPMAATAQNLHRVHRLHRDDAVDLTGIDLLIAADVTNPLTGPRGAALVFGPQKGASQADIDFLEAALANLVDAITRSGWDDADVLAKAPGAGAAGGCGFAAMVLGGTVVSGAEYFLDLLGFDEQLADAAVVVTGEGRLDNQTLKGKLPSVVARRAAPTPAIAVVGRNDLTSQTDLFAEIHTVVGLADTDPTVNGALTADILRRMGRCIGRRLRGLR